MYIFHGGCYDCERQDKPDGILECVECQFFEANWSLPDLNTSRMRVDKDDYHNEAMRYEVKRRVKEKPRSSNFFNSFKGFLYK